MSDSPYNEGTRQISPTIKVLARKMAPKSTGHNQPQLPLDPALGIVGNIHHVNEILNGRAESVNVEFTDNKGRRLHIWPGQTVIHRLRDIAFPGDRKGKGRSL